MMSQTETSSNQYGFYAVPKKLEPKKKYREEQDDEYSRNEEESDDDYNAFQEMDKEPVPDSQIERDFYVDEAPYPQFKPKERGLDYGVQIEKGDLFDYDLEVQPLLQILVGRSVVSAINELQEEKERKEKRQKNDQYQKKRNAELMVTQRLEAKSKRKQEESERRVLQKELYVKNAKQAGKKVIARKNAKNALLGLKTELFDELNEAGYLRSEPYSDLRINYEGWLYDQITSMIRQDAQITAEVTNMVNKVSEENERYHQQNMQKQHNRRQAILDERERIRKENKERKEQKKIRKQKRELNAEREPRAIKLDQVLDKHQAVDSILKAENLSDGFTSGQSEANAAPTVYVSGGLLDFVIVLMNSSEQNFTDEEVEKALEKLLSEAEQPLAVRFSGEHYQLIQSELKDLQENPNDWMRNKAERVKMLKEKLTLDLGLIEKNKVAVKSSLREAFLDAVLNIILGTTEVKKEGEQIEGQAYEPTAKDKLREQLQKKVEVRQSSAERLEELKEVLRIRFERKYEEQEEEKKRQETQNSENEWIDIYDGQGWAHYCGEHPEELDRSKQKAASYSVSEFESSFVYDERTLFFLQRELETLLDFKAGDNLRSYVEELGNIHSKVDRSIPVYDAELRQE